MHIAGEHGLFFNFPKLPHITQYPLAIFTWSILSETNFILQSQKLTSPKYRAFKHNVQYDFTLTSVLFFYANLYMDEYSNCDNKLKISI